MGERGVELARHRRRDATTTLGNGAGTVQEGSVHRWLRMAFASAAALHARGLYRSIVSYNIDIYGEKGSLLLTEPVSTAKGYGKYAMLMV